MHDLGQSPDRAGSDASVTRFPGVPLSRTQMRFSACITAKVPERASQRRVGTREASRRPQPFRQRHRLAAVALGGRQVPRPVRIAEFGEHPEADAVLFQSGKQRAQTVDALRLGMG